MLTPLANEFIKGAGDTTKGALKNLEKVLALDTTYGLGHAETLKKWADKLTGVKFLLVLIAKGYDPDKNDCKFKKSDPPIKYWDCAMQGVTLPGNLDVKKVSEEHCQLPNNYVKTGPPSRPGARDPEWLGPEDASTTPILHLEKVNVSGLPEIILTPASGGRTRASLQPRYTSGQIRQALPRRPKRISNSSGGFRWTRRAHSETMTGQKTPRIGPWEELRGPCR